MRMIMMSLIIATANLTGADYVFVGAHIAVIVIGVLWWVDLVRDQGDGENR